MSRVCATTADSPASPVDRQDESPPPECLITTAGGREGGTAERKQAEQEHSSAAWLYSVDITALTAALCKRKYTLATSPTCTQLTAHAQTN